LRLKVVDIGGPPLGKPGAFAEMMVSGVGALDFPANLFTL
jgi:hypothetical protein